MVAAKAQIAPERALGLERPSKWSRTEASRLGLCMPHAEQALCTGGLGAGQFPYLGDARGRGPAAVYPGQHCYREGPSAHSDMTRILERRATRLDPLDSSAGRHSPTGLAKPCLDFVSILGVHGWCQGYKPQGHRNCHRPERLKRPGDSLQCDSALDPRTGQSHLLKCE